MPVREMRSDPFAQRKAPPRVEPMTAKRVQRRERNVGEVVGTGRNGQRQVQGVSASEAAQQEPGGWSVRGSSDPARPADDVRPGALAASHDTCFNELVETGNDRPPAHAERVGEEPLGRYVSPGVDPSVVDRVKDRRGQAPVPRARPVLPAVK